MLVLSRKLEQSIMVGDDIEIKIISVQGDTVKLGISAPKNVPVHRKEIYIEIKDENIRAAGLGSSVNENINLMESLFNTQKKD